MVELFSTEPFHKKGYQHFCPFYGKFDKAPGKVWESLEDTSFQPQCPAETHCGLGSLQKDKLISERREDCRPAGSPRLAESEVILRLCC